VKSTTYGSRKAKDQKDGQSYGLDVGLGFFCGVDFLSLVALAETISHMSKDHESWVVDDGNHFMVPSFHEMISKTTSMIRIKERMLEPQGVVERLDLQCGEVQCQVCLP